MSAFMVGREHISYIVSTLQKCAMGRYGFSYYYDDGKEGRHNKVDGYELDQLSALGQMLWDANLKSINARYPDTVGKPENVPGLIGETYIYSHSHPWRIDEISLVQAFKAIGCLRYQSCEYDSWEKSEACRLLECLESALIKMLPGYDDAQWEILKRPSNSRKVKEAR